MGDIGSMEGSIICGTERSNRVRLPSVSQARKWKSIKCDISFWYINENTLKDLWIDSGTFSGHLLYLYPLSMGIEMISKLSKSFAFLITISTFKIFQLADI